MADPEEVEYEKFLEKVRRTVCIDELTPLATESIIRSAFDQFGTVVSVSILPNYLGPKDLPLTVLVEMENEEKAKAVISTVSQYPFMVGGMPRPVRATAARLEMFEDRPKKPGRTISCRWLGPNDPEFETAQKMKQLVHKHNAESKLLLKKQLEEEEKLAKRQYETAATHYKKVEIIEKAISDDVTKELASLYNMSLPRR